MKKRILSILLCCVMLVGLLPTVALAEGGVSYLDETGTSQTCDSATEVTSSDTEWTTGWYVVQGTVEIGSRVTVSGDVHLILTDGCTLTVNGGIQVQDNDKRIIIKAYTCECYGQIVNWLSSGMKEGFRQDMIRLCRLREGEVRELLVRSTRI